ncbi:MAG: hypothetical protein RLZZ444_2470 [Pseudomonadota bacterium]|jgi:hypothetical protein
MPHKHNSSRLHHIGQMKFKVTNRQEYEAGDLAPFRDLTHRITLELASETGFVS